MAAENPLLKFEPGLMIWTVVTFMLTMAILYKIAWKPLLAALDEREQRIKDALDQANKSQREAEAAIAETKRQSAESFRKSEALVAQAREEGELVRQRIVEEAKSESQRIVDQGMRRIEAEQRAALHEMRSLAGDLAIQAAGKLIQSSITDQQQREIVDKFLSEIPVESRSVN